MLRLLLTFSLFFILLSVTFTSTAGAEDTITLSLPESILAEAITAVLPIEVDATSKTLQGNITIINITDLKLSNQHLACRLALAGNQLQFLTEVGGHEIRLKVGSVEVDFKVKAKMRFDPKSQTLFVTPVIDEVTSSEDAGGGDIGRALVSLLNGKEFPIDLQDIDPIVARTGTKTLTVNTRVADVLVRKEHLQLYLIPKISAN